MDWVTKRADAYRAIGLSPSMARRSAHDDWVEMPENSTIDVTA